MKRIIALILVVLCLTIAGCTTNTEAATPTEPTFSIEQHFQVIQKDFIYQENLSNDEIITQQSFISSYIEGLMIELERDFFPDEMLLNEIERVQIIYDLYTDLLVERDWAEKAAEYPVATKVWRYLTEEIGYNSYVAAGIMGNIMAECGGQTLALDYTLRNSSGHYGLCQWSIGYKEMQWAELDEQLAFMKKDFPGAIDYWGPICYKRGFTHKDFMAMTDASEAAYAFCIIYERPGPGSYGQRRANAKVALEYFG